MLANCGVSQIETLIRVSSTSLAESTIQSTDAVKAREAEVKELKENRRRNRGCNL